MSSDYLFGRDEKEQARERLLHEIERVFGRHAAEAVDHLGRLAPHHRAIVAARVVGWVEALAEYEKRGNLPRLPMDEDRDRLLAAEDEGGVSAQPDEEPAALAAQPPPLPR